MLNSIRTFSFLFGYLPFSAFNLKKYKVRKSDMSSAEYDKMIHAEPQKWAKGIMQRTKSKITISGLESLPEDPVLFVSNHEGNFDIPVLLSEIPKPFGFISKEEVKKLPIIPLYMEEMNCVFIDRSDRGSAMKSIEETAQKLKEGHSVLIFPEGTRSKGQGLGEFKSGFMRIAIKSETPIVPIAIRGTADIMEKNDNKIKPANVTVQILEPVSPETIKAEGSKKAIQLVRSRIEEALKANEQSSLNG